MSQALSDHPVSLVAEGRSCAISTVTDGLPARLRALTAPRRGLILLDQAFRAEAETWARELPGFQVIFPTRPGEEAKTLDEARLILTALAEAGLSRDDWLIVRGGGSLTDLGALAAGLYQRGLRLILVPTTLLGAVDAAVGGKTAVNFNGAKNQVGHFYLPQNVLVDLKSLATLPRERLAEGLVEAYKTGLLFDPALAALAEDQAGPILEGDLRLTAEVARRSYAAKAALVARDFREEKGLRDVLNLGHTFGHLAESFYAPSLSHGRAVALGLRVAAEMSVARYGLSPVTAGRMAETARRLGGPAPPLPDQAAALNLLRADKKIRAGCLRFVFLEAPGRPLVADSSPEELLAAARRCWPAEN
ncbi:MAG: 3-dehydroquinate synthase [Candidatus Adiutrix sp.]|nr:3-dehydroquinate synthase [Candidatus Adiutrix sp.]